MDADDLILISVDDHVIEPPDLFVHVPKEQVTVGALREQAAGHDVSIVSRSTCARTPDEQLEGFRMRARRAIAAGAS